MRSRRALQICDLLEALADDLPQRAAPKWRDTQRQCHTVLRPHFLFLSDLVFPVLLTRTKGEVDRQELLLRLRCDCSDQVHALSDLDELLSDAFLVERFANEPESLGFALRGHFEALRRDLYWERDVLWPLAARTLTARDVATLDRAMRGVTVDAP